MFPALYNALTRSLLAACSHLLGAKRAAKGFPFGDGVLMLGSYVDFLCVAGVLSIMIHAIGHAAVYAGMAG